MADAADLTCELYCDEVYHLIAFLAQVEKVIDFPDDFREVYEKLQEWFNMEVRSDNT